MKRKVIVTAAVNGAAPRKALNPAVPEQPAELARAARECHDAGAAIVHFHIRGPQGEPACAPDILSEIDGEIRALSPIITQASTAPLRDVEESLALFQAENLPEMMTVAFGLMHLSTPKGDTLYPCTRSFLRRFLLEMRSHGVKPELELLSGASADDALELLSQGDCLEEPMSAVLLMGQPMQGVKRYDMDYLIQTFRRFPAGTQLSAACAGPQNLEAVILTLLLGGNVRVGMEETLWYREGEAVKSNAQLVERAVRLLRELDLEPATPAEARAILGLRPL